MSIINFLKIELKNFGKIERIIFPLLITLIAVISIYKNDNKIALVSAICGISYTILAGKGKILCYFIGIIGTICYSYLSFVNELYGNLALYALYYFPMEIIGIYKWKKHLKKETGEVIKTKLSARKAGIYFLITTFTSIILSFVLKYFGDSNPFLDAFATMFSVLGQFLTVKRCIEQWYVWFFVNLLSLIMWVIAYQNGSNCFATILMWLTYLCLAVYFYVLWKKEIIDEQ